MSTPEIIEYASILLVAAVKFVVASGYLVLPNSDFSYIGAVSTLILGGSMGTITFYFFSNFLNQLINKIFPKKKKKQRFSKKTRRIINIKNKYGLYGIALLGPVALSIPVGCFLASRFFYKRKITILVMLAGVVFWSLLIPLIKFTY